MMVDRENNFTLIHIVAALMVVIGHMFILAGFSPVAILGYEFHVLGVFVLFFVAGYLTAGSYERSKSVRSFFFKRFVRLYPPLLFCLVITALFLRLVSGSPELYFKSALRWFFDNARLKMNYGIEGVFTNLNTPAVNGSLWTLPIEVMCYFLVVPVLELVMWAKRKWNKAGGIIIAGVILFLLSFMDRYKTVLFDRDSLVIYCTDWFQGSKHMVMFFAGALIYILHLDRRIFNLQIGALAIVLYSFLGNVTILQLFVIAYLTMCFAIPEKPLFSKLFKKDLCYGLYLWAFPIQQTVVYLFSKFSFKPPYIVYLLTSVLFIWIMAIIQYELVEKRVSNILSMGLKK